MCWCVSALHCLQLGFCLLWPLLLWIWCLRAAIVLLGPKLMCCLVGYPFPFAGKISWCQPLLPSASGTLVEHTGAWSSTIWFLPSGGILLLPTSRTQHHHWLGRCWGTCCPTRPLSCLLVGPHLQFCHLPSHFDHFSHYFHCLCCRSYSGKSVSWCSVLF